MRKRQGARKFGYSWLPKVDGNYSWMYIFDDMYRGSSTMAGGKEPGPEGLVSDVDGRKAVLASKLASAP